MGKKSKSSRKGKKAWRANISTEDIEDFFEKSTKDALSGGSLAEVPSDSLFFVDKSIDLSAKRKIEKHREKVLHYESVLTRNAFAQPVPSSIQIKSKTKNDIAKAKASAKACKVKENVPTTSMVDIWDDQGKQNIKTKKMSKPMIIPAVEVEPPGCSYNPTFESHQDSLAHAVADEMQKIYRNELGPEPVPLVVPGEAVDDEDMYFLDADCGSEGDDDPNKDLLENVDGDIEKRLKTKRVTKVELNKRARRDQRLRKEAEAKKVEVLSKELDSLPDIVQEIVREEEEKKRRQLRRATVKEEKQRSGPPRLGRHRFEPAPVQVLLSEDITGSLRKLKACCTLAKDRYKSLEKRGLIAPGNREHSYLERPRTSSWMLFKLRKTREHMLLQGKIVCVF